MTIRQLIESIPHPIVRAQAITNMNLQETHIAGEEAKQQTIYWAIGCAFVWSETPEGVKYWGEIEKMSKKWH